jgi:hypothetical protein
MSDILTETKPKYEDLYNFLSSNPVQGYDIPKNIEEFLKQMKDKENANALYQTLKNSSDVKLAERHKDFETFRNNFDLNFDQKQKGAVNIVETPESKEGNVEIKKPDQTPEQEFKESTTRINAEYNKNLSNYKKQLENKEIKEERYNYLIKELNKNKKRDEDLAIAIEKERNIKPSHNPEVKIRTHDKNGKVVVNPTRLHDWTLLQKGEKDVSKANKFWNMSNAQKKDTFIPFLTNQYPGYNFSFIDETVGTRFESGASAKIEIEKNGERTTIDLSQNLLDSKRQLIDFVNKNGYDPVRTALNLSNDAALAMKVSNTPFNAEDVKSGGIALNESDKLELSDYGVFEETKTEVGNFKEFKYNPELYKTPRILLAEEMLADKLLTSEEAANPYSTAVAQKMLDIIRNPKYSKNDTHDALINYSEMEQSQDGDYVFSDPTVQAAYMEVGKGDWVETKYSLNWIDGAVSIEDYNKAETSLNMQRKKQGLGPASEEEVRTQAARNLYEKNRAEALNSHWDKYLASASKEERSDLLGGSLIVSDANIDKSQKLQALNNAELDNFNDPNTEDNLFLDYFEDIYNDPSKEFPASKGPMLKFKNGKIISEDLFNKYENAKNGKLARLQLMLDRRQDCWDIQDQSTDINASLDLLGRDYNTWRKSIVTSLNMFGDIGVGIGYYGAKAIEGISRFSLGMKGVDNETLDDIFEGYDNTLADWGQEWTDTKREIESRYSKNVEFHQDKWGGRAAFAGDFGTFVAQEVSTQIPILATMMLTGGTAGPLLIGAYSAGDHWMRSDMEGRKAGEYKNFWNEAAAATGYGASEAIFERLTTVPILKRGGSLIARMGERSIFDYRDAMKMYFRSQLPKLPLEAASEAVGEGLTQVAQNLIDGRNALENVDHAMFVGGMFGFGMSASPFLAGAVAQSFSDYGSMTQFRNITSELSSLETQKAIMINNGINVDFIEENIINLKNQQKAILNNKFNQIQGSLSNQAFNSFLNNTNKQEKIRINAKEILNNDKLSKQAKQNQLKQLKRTFDNLEYDSKTWKNTGAFGNDFKLLKTTNLERYNSIIAKAKENLKANKNKVDDLQQEAIQAEAYDLYVSEEIQANYEKQIAINKRKGVKTELLMSNTNKEANNTLNDMESATVERLKKEGASEEDIKSIRKKYKNLKENLANGFVNGVNIPAVMSPDNKNKSIIFKENAIKNDKRQVGTHEIGHWAFEELLSRNSEDFNGLASSIVDYLNQTKEGKDVLLRIQKRDVQATQAADELVMNFLEEVGNDNVPISDEFAALFGLGTNTGMMQATNGEMKFDFKGSTDAVAFVIGLGKAISSGQLTSKVLKEAKQSPVVSSLNTEKIVKEVTSEIKKSGVAEDEKEKKIRRDLREEDIKEIYDLYAWDKNQEEWEEFLETDEGRKILDQIIAPYEIEIEAIAKGNKDVVSAAKAPIIRHIKAFNPQENTDLAGYIGGYLSRKVGSGRKTLEKGAAPKGTKIKRIGEKQEGGREFDIADTSKPVDIDAKPELNFRKKLEIETGGKLYNSILKKAKIVLSTLPTTLTVPKTNQTLSEVKKKLQENPNDYKAVADLNRIFKEFRKTLKNAFDTQLFKEIKDSMGVREAYSDYLKVNKKAILTGLPIADLVAMQKAKGANKILVKPIKENLSPNEIKQYEGSPDLMYTSPTSGPTIYKRLDPKDKDFVDFMKVRGRKDALARNIAGKLGEDAAMQTLASKEVMDSFLTKNPTLKEIPTDMLSNSIAQAIDSGVGMKFSSNESQRNVFKEHGVEFVNNLKQQNLGTTKRAIKAALIKTFINENPSEVWGKTLEEQEKTLDIFAGELKIPITKYLKPEGKTSLKRLGAVVDVGDFTIEEINQRELSENLQKLLNLDTNLAEAFEDPANITFQRDLEAAFVEDLVNKKGKEDAVRIALTILKGHNATSGKIGATSLGTRPADPGVKPQPRYQVFESIEDYINTVVNTLPGVKVIMGKTKDGKTTIESVTIDGKPIDKYPSREAQKSKTKKHFEETFDKREVEAQEAWDTMIDYLKFVYKNGNNLSFAMNMMSLKSNMDSMLKASALAKYYYVGPAMKTIDLRYEHMIPTENVVINLTKHFLGDKIDLQALKDKYNVAIIPKQMDDNINVQFQKSMPSDWTVDMSETERYYGDLMLGYNNMYALEVIGGPNKGDIIGKQYLKLNESIIKAKESNKIKLSNNVTASFKNSSNNNEIISYAKTIDEALSIARDPNAPVKKIRVFDFDDTLATTKSDVLFKAPDRTEGRLTAEKFAMDGARLLGEGYVFDFSEFNKVTKGKPGPLLDIAKKIQAARGTEDVFVLTARAPEAQVAIKEFLDSVGLNIPLKNITGLGNSTGAAKAKWMVEKAAEGYNDFYFADDAYQNVKAVKDAMSVIDVKSEVQQAKMKFSKNVNKDFNKIIEETTGVEAYKSFSDAKARIFGKRNERMRILPFSAEDFEGLIYPMLGKGKQGEKHYEFFDEHLFKPFARAMANLSIARINVMDDFRKLKESLNVPKEIKKKNKTKFTNEVAVRSYIWTALGEEIPGLSKTDLKELLSTVENNPSLKAFAEEVLKINKGKYTSPKSDWLAGTITTDIIGTLNSLNRSEYLKEWKENKDLIFTKENLNKLEAIYGPKYREALENSLARMEKGSNRISSQNRVGGRILDYLNNSQGVVMFLNMKSALLQTISSINFINWTFNNPLQASAAFANQPQYWKDFMTLMNSKYLVDRRNGLRINVSEAEVSEAAKTSTNKAKAAVSWIIQKGYAPTQFADSFAIASGGATWYRNRIKNLMKTEGLTEAQAETKAMLEFREISEKSQQSSRPDRISQQQASDTGRLLLNWANTQQQYVRIQAKAISDLINGRGDAKEHLSKIVYYGVIQSLIFNAAQQALFALGFNNEDDDEVKNKKYINIANGTADGVLRGLGIGGHIVSVLKNTAMDLYQRSERSRPEYADAMWKLIQVSPVVDSKIKRLKQAAWQFDSKQRRQEMVEKGFDLDNPAYDAMAKVIAATTNIPLDRVLTKFDNIQEVLNSENETWMRIAILLGWSKWMLEGSADKKSSKTKKQSPFKTKRKTTNSPFAVKKKKNKNPFSVN